MSTEVKLSVAQTSKMIQSGGFFGSWLGNLGKEALTSITIPLARDNLPGLVKAKGKSGRVYVNQNFYSSSPSFKQYWDY